MIIFAGDFVGHVGYAGVVAVVYSSHGFLEIVDFIV